MSDPFVVRKSKPQGEEFGLETDYVELAAALSASAGLDLAVGDVLWTVEPHDETGTHALTGAYAPAAGGAA